MQKASDLQKQVVGLKLLVQSGVGDGLLSGLLITLILTNKKQLKVIASNRDKKVNSRKESTRFV